MNIVFEAERGRAEAIRLKRALRDEGVYADRHIAQSLKRQGLRAKAAREFKTATNSNHRLRVAPNLLAQDL